MKLLITSAAFFASFGLPLGETLLAPGTSRLHGIVYTHQGSPAPKVTVLIQGLYPPATLNSKVLTDENGHFAVDGLKPGQYALFPYGDYPGFLIRHDTFLIANDQVDRVVIPEHSPDVLKNLTLPTEAAVINVQIVSEPVISLQGAEIVVCHAEAPVRSGTAQLDANNGFTYVVPSEEILSILLILPSGRRVQETGLSFKPGEKVSLVLRINKNSKIEGKQCVPFQAG